jgi:hypothetical protein
MKYTKLRQYFEKNDMESLLKDCEDVFTTLDDYKEQFIANNFSTGDEYKEALNRITGCYMFLEPILSLSQAFKEIKQDEAHSNLRVDAETNGKKLTADALNVESHKAVSLYIRVRNIIEAYVKNSEKAIITIQTVLKREENERQYKTQN